MRLARSLRSVGAKGEGGRGNKGEEGRRGKGEVILVLSISTVFGSGQNTVCETNYMKRMKLVVETEQKAFFTCLV